MRLSLPAMPRPSLAELQNDLLRAGIAPRHVRRTVGELNDHYEDLVKYALLDGADIDTAQVQALDDLGDLHDVARAMRSQPELRSWAFRFPYLAMVVYPLTFFALKPVMVGVELAGPVARWATCVFLGGIVTAGIFLFMQLSIALT